VPPKNRYEHVHVRLFQAILGLQHFWEALPAKASQLLVIVGIQKCRSEIESLQQARFAGLSL